MNGRWDADGRTPETAGPAGVRIGDADRERAVTALGDHFAAGRLTHEELDDRLERAWQAKTARDLTPLFTDLPGGAFVARAAQLTDASERVRRPMAFPLPLLLFVAIVLTIATHVPVVFFLVGWLAIGRYHHRGASRRTYRYGG